MSRYVDIKITADVIQAVAVINYAFITLCRALGIRAYAVTLYDWLTIDEGELK